MELMELMELMVVLGGRRDFFLCRVVSSCRDVTRCDVTDS